MDQFPINGSTGAGQPLWITWVDLELPKCSYSMRKSSYNCDLYNHLHIAIIATQNNFNSGSGNWLDHLISKTIWRRGLATSLLVEIHRTSILTNCPKNLKFPYSMTIDFFFLAIYFLGLVSAFGFGVVYFVGPAG